MALVLSLRTGSDFYIDAVKYHCVAIGPERESVSGFYCDFVLKRGDKEWQVRYGEQLYPEPGVLIRAASRKRMKGRLASVSITAEGKKVGRKQALNCPTCGGTKIISTQEMCSNCKGSGCLHCKNSGFITYRSNCPDCV